MPVGNVWAWPSDAVSAEDAERAMKRYAERAGEVWATFTDFGDALQVASRWTGMGETALVCDHVADDVRRELKMSEILPELARMVAASPVDAAFHDAVGRVHGRSSFDVLGPAFCNHDLAHYLDQQFAGEYLDSYTLRQPKPTMPLYHLVGALDPLTDGDVDEKIGDGLPETLAEWTVADGLTHFKIKLAGDDLDWDVDRVLAVERVVAEAKRTADPAAWQYSCDFNEKCQDAAYVVEFLDRVKAGSAAAFDRIQYLEQPTHRNLGAHPIPVHEAAKVKPVVIDESLTGKEGPAAGGGPRVQRRRAESLQGADGKPADGGHGSEAGAVLVRAGSHLPGGVLPAQCQSGGPDPDGRGDRGERPPVLPGPQRGVGPAVTPDCSTVTDGTVKTGELNGPGLGFA